MPKIDLRLFQEADGRVPLFDFLDELSPRHRAQIIALLERLADVGHELRPPHTEHLGGGLHYLRRRMGTLTARIFYWFHGSGLAVVGHGFLKKTAKCPPGELRRAQRMRSAHQSDPAAHTHQESEQ